jgi:hypothetical protein
MAGGPAGIAGGRQYCVFHHRFSISTGDLNSPHTVLIATEKFSSDAQCNFFLRFEVEMDVNLRRTNTLPEKIF